MSDIEASPTGRVTVRLDIDAELLHAASWAMKANVDSLARHAKRFPKSEFDWPKAVAEASEQAKAFDEAIQKAVIIGF